MRFSCEGCNAKYMISDDKVGAGGVKVRCKKCGHVTVVRRSEPELELPVSSSGPPVAEWWVAIDEQPVGPIAPEEVRRHWEAGTLHSESLVWHSGLAEWSPIHAVPQLAGPLGAVAPPPPPEGDGAPPDANWRPNAASALAALDEPPHDGGYPEGGPKGEAAAPAAAPSPVDLPPPPTPSESAPIGQDPSGMHPLPMAGLERTGERRIATTPGPRGPGVRSASIQAPRKESRSLPLVLAVALLVVAAAAVGLWLLTR